MGFRNRRLCKVVYERMLLSDGEMIDELQVIVKLPWVELADFVEEELAINYGLKRCAGCGTWSLDFHGEYCFDCRGE